MARLFITPREIDFISDLTKEITKDVIGQKIFYYKVREDISNVHEIYEEAIEKVFDPPIEIDARVNWAQSEPKTTKFGFEERTGIEVYIHFRDMIDKDIKLLNGDYLSYGDIFYEITSIKQDKTIFGQIEHIAAYILTARQARQGQINKVPVGPTSEIYTDQDSETKEWSQQRGAARDADNKLTGDKRILQTDGILEAPISGPHKIVASGSAVKSSFYGDE